MGRRVPAQGSKANPLVKLLELHCTGHSLYLGKTFLFGSLPNSKQNWLIVKDHRHSDLTPLHAPSSNHAAIPELGSTGSHPWPLCLKGQALAWPLGAASILTPPLLP